MKTRYKKQIPKWPFVALGVMIVLTVTLALWPRPTIEPEPVAENPNGGAEYLKMRRQEDHPVTPDMENAANSLGGEMAADFALPDTEGKIHTLAELSADKPLLIFFVERECPCCLGAKHFVDRMQELYRGELNAVGIINAEDRVSRTWKKVTKAKFTVLEDPEQKVIRAYKAERGVYTTLVAPGGKIVKAYPGYSLTMLRDLSSLIAELAGVEDKGFESNAAPEEMTSGCLFPEVWTEAGE